MKTAQEQLSTYKSVHLNQSNIRTHFVGVPLIIWSLVVLLSLVSIPMPFVSEGFSVNLSHAFFVVAMIYYAVLRWRLAIGLLLFLAPTVYLAHRVSLYENAYLLAIAVFVVGWVIQFIGHQYEKAKPAFLDDLNQLMIGPFFLMAELYFMLGLELALEKEITPIAVEKRRALEAARKTAAA